MPSSTEVADDLHRCVHADAWDRCTDVLNLVDCRWQLQRSRSSDLICIKLLDKECQGRGGVNGLVGRALAWIVRGVGLSPT